MELHGNLYVCRVYLYSLLLFVFSICAQSELPRVQFSDLQYLGAFKLPDEWGTTRSDYSTFRYAKGPVAFNPHSTVDPNAPSLFIACFSGSGNVSEISIPASVITTDKNELPVASIIQGCTSVEQGVTQKISYTQGGIGGLLISGNKMYISAYNGYPASGCDTISHYVKSSLDLSILDVAGAYRVKNTAGGVCFVNGPMTWIPSEWRALLGNKPAITYNCCHSIISMTSLGPAAFSFDPSQIGPTPAQTVALQWYSSSHPTLGNWNGKGKPLEFKAPWDNSWNNAPVPGYRGLVIPDGTRSALYFTAQGIGTYCYGEGTSDSSLVGKATGDGSSWCYDPDGTGKGDHSYPYRFHIMAFDLNDWAKVAAGEKQPWEVVPYAVWPLVSPAIPFANGKDDGNAGGAAYDPATRRIYWEQSCAWGECVPIVHVWQVSSATPVRSSPLSFSPNSISVHRTMHSSKFRITYGSVPVSSIQIYNCSGRLIADLAVPGHANEIIWDASSHSNELYVLKVKSAGETFTELLSLVK